MIGMLNLTEPELVRLCRAKTWISVSERSMSHPTEATPTDSAVRGEGSTALSVAVRSRAPIQVIQQLLTANFFQIGVTHKVRGSVLHEALKHRASDAVLHCLIRAAIAYEENPRTGNGGNYGLLGHKDELGRTALHYVVDRTVRSLDRGERCQENWNIVRTLVQAFPPSVSSIDADGNTPLILLLLIPKFRDDIGGLELEHEVFRLVQLMVTLCPKAISVSRRLPRPWHYQFKCEGHAPLVHGDGVPSPLSCALLHGRSIDTVELLLEANRQTGVSGCRTIVTHHREIPLHIAATMRCSAKVLWTLAREDAEVVGVADLNGLTALDWVWARHVLDWCTSTDPFAPVMVSRRRYLNAHFLEWHERVSKQYLGVDKSMETSRNRVVRAMAASLKEDISNRMSIILPMMVSQHFHTVEGLMIDGDGVQLPLVHAACLVNCPLAMVQLAIDSSPCHVKSKDELMERLPLHYAATRTGYVAQYPVGVSCNVQRIEEVSAIALILARFPEACRVTDSYGQLPLHIAIDNAKRGGENEELCHDPTKLERQHSEIHLLLDRYPDSLHRRDGKTTLFPFLQAAEGPAADASLTYMLLRRDPSLLRVTCE